DRRGISRRTRGAEVGVALEPPGEIRTGEEAEGPVGRIALHLRVARKPARAARGAGPAASGRAGEGGDRERHRPAQIRSHRRLPSGRREDTRSAAARLPGRSSGASERQNAYGPPRSSERRYAGRAWMRFRKAARFGKW